jgi:predicted metal-dependent RNase
VCFRLLQFGRRHCVFDDFCPRFITNLLFWHSKNVFFLLCQHIFQISVLMEIQFYGAARTVTGSLHLIKANGKTILLDCGLFQGRRAEAYERNKTFPFDASKIDAVVLSHAHTDHAGNLPNLLEIRGARVELKR